MKSINSPLPAETNYLLSSLSAALRAPRLCVLFFLLFSSTAAPQTRHPAYGGTLRVELRTSSVSLNPREWQPGSFATSENEKLASLLYDRLISLDDYGRFQPQLATEWSHDPAARVWQFKLRTSATFSDGSPLTPEDVIASLQVFLPAATQLASTASSITIRLAHSTPDFLEQLASGRFFICRAQPDKSLLGTGPFTLAENSASSDANSVLRPAHLKFRARLDSWSGRPFLDAIEVTLGQPALRQLIDLQVAKADLIDLAPDLVRKAQQENLRVWTSAPATLVALRFDPTQPEAGDPLLREALDRALDRDTMARVLLQRQADPASALLPPWLSGYASLFDSPADPARTNQVLAQFHRQSAAVPEALRLKVDGSGDLLKLLAERVVVNARQANLPLQLALHAPESAAAKPADREAFGLHLFLWHYDSLSPRAELEELVKLLNIQESQDASKTLNDSEQLYALEKRILDSRAVLPLLLLPDSVVLGPNVRNWSPARWGDWRLADVWLEQPAPAAPPSGTPAPRKFTATQPAGVRP